MTWAEKPTGGAVSEEASNADAFAEAKAEAESLGFVLRRVHRRGGASYLELRSNLTAWSFATLHSVRGFLNARRRTEHTS